MWTPRPYLQRQTNPMGQNPLPTIPGMPHPMPVVAAPISPNPGAAQAAHLNQMGQPNLGALPEQETMRHLGHFNNLKRMLKRTI